jgi:nitrate/nitrite transporter NarK
MDLFKRVLGLVVAALVLVVVVLAARWTGEKIRERFLFPAKPPVTVYQPGNSQNNSSSEKSKTATYSAIPQTGPESFGLVMAAVSALGGLSSLYLAKKSS